jgi:predicted aspartyl protease
MRPVIQGDHEQLAMESRPLATPVKYRLIIAMLVLLFGSALCAGEVVRVPLKIISGRPCVRANVNGHTLWLVIDTGSAVSVLEASAARECGLEVAPGGVQATGMLGTERLRRTTAGAVQIGALDFPPRPWLVRQIAPFKSAVQFNLIGMDRLPAMSRWVTLDGPKREAVFGTQRFRAERGAAYTSAPLETRRGLPYVEIGVGAARVSCIVDTGSSVPLLLDPATAAGLVQRTFRAASGRPLGFGGQASARTETWSTTLPEVTLGNGVLTKIRALVLPHPPALGYGAFERAAVTFDFEAQRVWLRK